MSDYKYIRFFDELGIDDVPLVGGKNASLGEMYRKLSAEGVRIPNGFAITARAYDYMLDAAGAWDTLHEALDALDPDDVTDLARRGKRAREIVYGAGLPDDLADEIIRAYRQLLEEYGTVKDIQPVEFGVNYFEGIALKDPAHLADDELRIRYYLPEEESSKGLGDDRLVDLANVGLVVRQRRRQRCEAGLVFLGGGDYVEGYREIIHYETGFMPPFQSKDVLLLVDDLRDMGYDGFILGDIWYMGKERCFSEADMFYDQRLASRIIEDACV
ncbi:MAG: PEP/pyruvate-binding domain-containing protein [Acidihalobacter sp.]